MGYNRSGHTRTKRLKRARRHLERLARKSAGTQAAPAKPPAQS